MVVWTTVTMLFFLQHANLQTNCVRCEFKKKGRQIIQFKFPLRKKITNFSTNYFMRLHSWYIVEWLFLCIAWKFIGPFNWKTFLWECFMHCWHIAPILFSCLRLSCFIVCECIQCAVQFVRFVHKPNQKQRLYSIEIVQWHLINLESAIKIDCNQIYTAYSI